eukprot:10764057-Lingulodinium_polyedra.AAC.1
MALQRVCRTRPSPLQGITRSSCKAPPDGARETGVCQTIPVWPSALWGIREERGVARGPCVFQV